MGIKTFLKKTFCCGTKTEKPQAFTKARNLPGRGALGNHEVSSVVPEPKLSYQPIKKPSAPPLEDIASDSPMLPHKVPASRMRSFDPAETWMQYDFKNQGSTISFDQTVRLKHEADSTQPLPPGHKFLQASMSKGHSFTIVPWNY